MRKTISIIFVTALLIVLTFLGYRKIKVEKNVSIQPTEKATRPSQPNQIQPVPPENLRENILTEFQNITPKIWSESAPGVETELPTRDKVLALTFDACGGTGSDGYDAQLIDFLTAEKIPATLFISGKWIDANLENFKKLASVPLFEIENHGTAHIPCSADGHSAYNISGTKNIGEMIDEIDLNAQRLESLIGKKPLFYRSATTFTDEICPQVARELGYTVVSFNVLGDAGATYSATQVEKTLLNASPGSIVILHMNHPEKDTAEGVIQAVPKLEKAGWRFVKLEDYK